MQANWHTLLHLEVARNTPCCGIRASESITLGDRYDGSNQLDDSPEKFSRIYAQKIAVYGDADRVKFVIECLVLERRFHQPLCILN